MYVYVYEYVCVWVYAYMYMYMYLCIYVYMYICMYVYIYVCIYMFPAQKCRSIKKRSHETGSPSEKVHGCRILPYLANNRCASQERATQCCDFSRSAAGKTFFCIPCLRTSHTRWGKTDNSDLQGLASPWDNILTPARDATQRRGATTSRRATVGLGTKGVTRTFTGTKCGQVQDPES